MFRRAAPALFRSAVGAPTRACLAKTLPNAFNYCETAPSDVPVGSVVEAPTEVALTLTRQDEFLYAAHPVKSVVINTANGRMGILPGHEYVVEKLAPGLIEIEADDGKFTKYATSGGFAQVSTDGNVDINTAECIALDSFDPAAVEKELNACQELTKSGDEDAKARGEVGVAVLEPVMEALK
eukprot:TRINITY_DN12117_c0_g1_i1.p4 TRINITY_DN12117_c0_g1~~TRINITY_DN12117_c0_g1_i1.p4  ORF type:complete len:212 (+),score=87.62 TRINITY_DN12117_c0_g1_i1:91-636(+)